MSEQPQTVLQQQCGWTKLYHPSGAHVTLPVVGPGPHEMFEAVSAMVEAGWLVTAPGLEEGEQKFEAVAVCVRAKGNEDGSDTPVVDLYERDFEWKSLSVYLNRDEDRRAFEAASGLSLPRLTPFPGQAAPQRGAARQTDTFIHEAPRAFGVVCRPNPKYDPGETDAKKKKPKRLFVRWAGQGAGAKEPDSPPVVTAEEANEIKHLIADCELADSPVNMPAFLAWIGAASVEQIRRGDYEKAVRKLREKLQFNGGAK